MHSDFFHLYFLDNLGLMKTKEIYNIKKYLLFLKQGYILYTTVGTNFREFSY